MTGDIVLAEYADNRIELDIGDVAALERQTRGAFVIRRDLGGNAVIVNPRQYVGVLSLPSGRRLSVAPKVLATNLFLMLAIAYGLPTPFRDEPAAFADLDAVLEFLVVAFARMVEERIVAGLHRSYVEREDNLAAVRGRIVVAEDGRRNHVLRHRTWCRYAEFTWDIPENQVIRQVAHLLAGWVREPRLRLRLWRIDHSLGEVSPTHVPVEAIDRFVYDRQNRGYEPIHRLCRLFLRGSSLSEHAGETTFRTFLVDMNALFEAFVGQVLREAAPAGMAVVEQDRGFLDRDGLLAIRPDILVTADGRPALVADCKYKRQRAGEFIQHDVYQVLAYCTALGLDRGLIVYPRHEGGERGDLAIRNHDARIRVAALDLGGEPADLQRACREFAGGVFAWAGRRAAPMEPQPGPRASRPPHVPTGRA